MQKMISTVNSPGMAFGDAKAQVRRRSSAGTRASIRPRAACRGTVAARSRPWRRSRRDPGRPTAPSRPRARRRAGARRGATSTSAIPARATVRSAMATIRRPTARRARVMPHSASRPSATTASGGSARAKQRARRAGFRRLVERLLQTLDGLRRRRPRRFPRTARRRPAGSAPARLGMPTVISAPPSNDCHSTGPVMPLRDQIVEGASGAFRALRRAASQHPRPEHDDRTVEEDERRRLRPRAPPGWPPRRRRAARPAPPAPSGPQGPRPTRRRDTQRGARSRAPRVARGALMARAPRRRAQ